jgi:hypothetical protein
MNAGRTDDAARAQWAAAWAQCQAALAALATAGDVEGLATAQEALEAGVVLDAVDRHNPALVQPFALELLRRLIARTRDWPDPGPATEDPGLGAVSVWRLFGVADRQALRERLYTWLGDAAMALLTEPDAPPEAPAEGDAP